MLPRPAAGELKILGQATFDVARLSILAANTTRTHSQFSRNLQIFFSIFLDGKTQIRARGQA